MTQKQSPFQFPPKKSTVGDKKENIDESPNLFILKTPERNNQGQITGYTGKQTIQFQQLRCLENQLGIPKKFLRDPLEIS